MNSTPDQTQVEDWPVTQIARVGPKIAASLEKIGIMQIKDLLFHLPYRYLDKTTVTPIGSLTAGDRMLVIGRIKKVQVGYSGRRTLTVHLEDDSGRMTMRLFHFNNRQLENLQRSAWIRCFGEVRFRRQFEMIHPEYMACGSKPKPVENDRLTPVYRRTEGISQLLMQSIVKAALEMSGQSGLRELLPAAICKQYQMPPLADALAYAHTPPLEMFEFGVQDYEMPSIRRLIFEELVAFQVARQQQKQIRQSGRAAVMNPSGDLSKRLKDSLAFAPTRSQSRVIREILNDLRQEVPMLRLVQGDVGSGKTLVAAAAVAWVVDCSCQAAVMAPTELLAEQHYKTFAGWFVPLGIDVQLLTGRMTAKERRNVQHAVEHGSAKIIIGTHALFQEGVKFKRLGIIVVDEQHRFGVGQRYALREKGVQDNLEPHQLVMTATPIPRTLAMTFYADLDVSSVTELPPGRIAVRTKAFPLHRRAQVLDAVKKRCAAGQQVYWVCPIIDKSETIDAQAAVEAEKYIAAALQDCRVELIHGRMKSAERDRIMNRFRNGQVEVLVATTVIEVGVDVPNATLMVIESADRLGLAQLHQLRGRVGRGAVQSHCILLHKDDPSELAQKRLAVMEESNDGFKISEIDLQLRGAGELLGTRQTGAQLFRIAELPRDMELLDDVKRTATVMLEHHAETIVPLIRRWTAKEGEYAAV